MYYFFSTASGKSATGRMETETDMIYNQFTSFQHKWVLCYVHTKGKEDGA